MSMEPEMALVTGGSRGIGRAVCLELAQAGWHVLVNYLSNTDAAEETLTLIRAAGGRGEAVRFDVADRQAVQEALTPILERPQPVTVLVNNAGITADGLFALMPPEDWDRVIATSLAGFYNVTRPVVMKMAAAKRGSIVSLSSVSARFPNRGQSNYAAAKAGLIGASRSLAAEVARLGIRVNVVAPGIIETDMTAGMRREHIRQIVPMARVGRPEEVARVVRFLCTGDASYVTGQVIAVNGGMI